MSNIFEISDKTGRKIRLTENKWVHILEHKGMGQYLEEIKNTLIKPDLIVQHKFDYNRRNYYKYQKNKKKYL